MEFPPCHIGDFFPAIRGVSSNPNIEFPKGHKWSLKQATNGVSPITVYRVFMWSHKMCVYELRRADTEIRSPFIPMKNGARRIHFLLLIDPNL